MKNKQISDVTVHDVHGNNYSLGQERAGSVYLVIRSRDPLGFEHRGMQNIAIRIRFDEGHPIWLIIILIFVSHVSCYLHTSVIRKMKIKHRIIGFSNMLRRPLK